MPAPTRPVLTRRDPDRPPRGVVLMFHGGQESSHDAVDASSASWRRSRVMQEMIAGRCHEAGVASWLLRYRQRGWNDTGAPSPVPDAHWSLAQVRAELGALPVVLLGHSMGARTAVRVAADPMVRGVVALAPWFPVGEPVAPLAGRTLHAAHGHADRITSFDATAGFVRRSAAVADHAELRDMGAVGHYLLRRPRAWNRFAVERSLAVLNR